MTFQCGDKITVKKHGRLAEAMVLFPGNVRELIAAKEIDLLEEGV